MSKDLEKFDRSSEREQLENSFLLKQSFPGTLLIVVDTARIEGTELLWLLVVCISSSSFNRNVTHGFRK